MDEVVRDEVAKPVDDAHIRNKENEFSLKPGSSNILQSIEMVTPNMADYPENSNDPYSDILEVKNLDRIGSSEHANASPRCMNDAGVVVEELTLSNYDGEKLAIIAGGSGISNLYGQNGYKEKVPATSSTWEDGGNNFFSGLLDQTQPLPNYNHNAIVDNLFCNDDKGTSGDMLYSSGGIRTKILSRSGFSEYFIKSTLRGKGVIRKSPASRRSNTESGDQDNLKCGIAGLTNSVAPLGSTTQPVLPLSRGVCEPWISPSSNSIGDRISLREWLESGGNKANKVERLRIFRQILDLLDFPHSYGVFLQDFMPSCFKLLGMYQVMYLGSSTRARVIENVTDQDIRRSNHNQNGKRPIHQIMPSLDSPFCEEAEFG
ncbi:hypothetical protein Pfo_025308 [Paulownia fortunei]|nr:hypothetical protein Pfo_025308 [Paulownia fortunei]